MPLWQSAKRRFLSFAIPYFIKAEGKFQQWANLFYNEMDEITLTDDGLIDSKPISEQHLSNAVGGENFEQAYYCAKSTFVTQLLEIKKFILRSYEKISILVESFSGRVQNLVYNQVMFEVVNADQQFSVRISNKSRTFTKLIFVEENPFISHFKILGLNSEIKNDLRHFTKRFNRRFLHYKDVAIALIYKFLENCLNLQTENMYLPPIPTSGFSFTANDPGYP